MPLIVLLQVLLQQGQRLGEIGAQAALIACHRSLVVVAIKVGGFLRYSGDDVVVVVTVT